MNASYKNTTVYASIFIFLVSVASATQPTQTEPVPFDLPLPDSLGVPLIDTRISDLTPKSATEMDEAESEYSGDGNYETQGETGSNKQDSNDYYNIPDLGVTAANFPTKDIAPSGAIVTNIEYGIRIDDRGDPQDFRCQDYVIYLSSSTTSGYLYRDVLVYAYEGGETDEGRDDDFFNDSDIDLFKRYTSSFNGENANQYWGFIVYDKIAGRVGRIESRYITIYYEIPDLDVDADVEYIKVEGNTVSAGGSITIELDELGDSFEVMLKGENDGDDTVPAWYSNLTLSFPQFTSSGDKDRISVDGSTSSDLEVNKYYGSEAQGGDAYANYVMVEGADDNGWYSGESNYLYLDIKPKEWGDFVIYYRMGLAKDETWDNFDYDPSTGYCPSCGDRDCLSFASYKITVKVRPTPPEPNITYISFPSTITYGQSFNLVINSRNDGEYANEGDITVSFPDFTSGNESAYVRSLSTTTLDYVEETGTGWDSEFDRGEEIYYRDGGEDQINADYLMVGGLARPWTSGKTHTLALNIKPQKAGTFNIYIRSAMHAGEYDERGVWVNDPPDGSGDRTDQQNWRVYRKVVTVEVQKPSPDITSIVVPTTVDFGKSFDLTVTVKNVGFDADAGDITVAFPEFTSGDESKYVTHVTGTTIDYVEEGEGAEDSEYDKGEKIYTRESETQITAAYLMVGGTAYPWDSGDSETLKLRITPQSPGSFPVYIRSAMHAGPYDDTGVWVNDPPDGSGDRTDQQGWRVYEKIINVKVLEPGPNITSISLPSKIEFGESFNLAVTVINDGYEANEGDITISFPDFTNGDESKYVTSLSSTTIYYEEEDGSEWDSEFDRGELIYTRDGGEEQSVAEYLMVGGLSKPWASSQSHTLALSVTPQRGGTFHVYIRSAMHAGPYDDTGVWVNDPRDGSGDRTDQQGWRVEERLVTVEVIPPNPTITSIQLPEEIKYGNSFDLIVESVNYGVEANEGDITVSFPDFTAGNESNYVKSLSATTLDFTEQADGVEWDSEYNQGEMIYYRDGGEEQIAADYLMVGGMIRPWPEDQAKTLALRIVPQNAGVFPVYIRSAMHAGPYDESGVWVNDPGDGTKDQTDQQDWGTYFRSVNVTVDPPSPNLYSVEIPSSVNMGESFEVVIRSRNDGAISNGGDITVSFPQFNDGNESQFVQSLPATTMDYVEEGEGQDGDSEYDRGELIYTRYGGDVQSTASYLMVGGTVETWGAGVSQTLALKVTPQQAGPFKIYIRSAMHAGPYNETGVWLNAPSDGSGDGTDQQSWEIVEYTVNVVKPLYDEPISFPVYYGYGPDYDPSPDETTTRFRVTGPEEIFPGVPFNLVVEILPEGYKELLPWKLQAAAITMNVPDDGVELAALPTQEIYINNKGEGQWHEASPPDDYWSTFSEFLELTFLYAVGRIPYVGAAISALPGFTDVIYKIKDLETVTDDDMWDAYDLSNRFDIYQFPDNFYMDWEWGVVSAKRYTIPIVVEDPKTTVHIQFETFALHKDLSQTVANSGLVEKEKYLINLDLGNQYGYGQTSPSVAAPQSLPIRSSEEVYFASTLELDVRVKGLPIPTGDHLSASVVVKGPKGIEENEPVYFTVEILPTGYDQLGAWKLTASRLTVVMADKSGSLSANPKQQLYFQSILGDGWAEGEQTSKVWEASKLFSDFAFETIVSLDEYADLAYKLGKFILQKFISTDDERPLTVDEQWAIYNLENVYDTYEIPDYTGGDKLIAAATAKRYQVPVQLADLRGSVDLLLDELRLEKDTGILTYEATIPEQVLTSISAAEILDRYLADFPETPQAVSPADESVLEDLQPTFEWTPFHDGGDGEVQAGYQVRVRSDIDDSVVYDTGFIPASSGQTHTYSPGEYSGEDPETGLTRVSDPLEWSTHYHWHVRFQDSGGDWSGWSADDPEPHQDFYTPQPPEIVVNPDKIEISSQAGSFEFSVSNGGGGDLVLEVTIGVGGDWLSEPSIQMEGDEASIRFDYEENAGNDFRVGEIELVSDGAINSPVTVYVIQAGTTPHLAVHPQSQSVGSEEGICTFSVSNTGTGSLTWTANIIEGGSWMTILSGGSGTGGGEIEIHFSTNLSESNRIGSIEIVSAEADNSPQIVSLDQQGSIPTIYTLSVNSVGVTDLQVNVSPADLDGRSDGVVPFSRDFYSGTEVELSVPTYAGGNNFLHWIIGDEVFEEETVAEVVLVDNSEVTAVYNRPPAASPDTMSVYEEVLAGVDALGNDVDLDGGQLMISHVTQGKHGGSYIEEGDTTIAYCSDREYSGYDTLLYSISDGSGGVASSFIALNVLPVNDAPEFVTALPDTSFHEDHVLVLPLQLWRDVVLDPDNEVSELTWRLIGEEHLEWEVEEDTVILSSAENWFGNDTVSVVVSDGQLEDTTGLIVTVNSVNDPPAPFTLESPDDGGTLDSLSVWFLWGKSFDVDLDTVKYTLHVGGSSLDTSIVGISDTFYVFDGSGLDQDSIYTWRVSALDGFDTTDCESDFSFSIDMLLGVDDELTIPKSYALRPNYPNPFNMTTKIRYEVPFRSRVGIDVYNILGQKVTRLVNEDKAPGYYSLLWDGKSGDGVVLPSGTYIIRMISGGYKNEQKMILIK